MYVNKKMLVYLACRCFQNNTFSLPLRVKINICTIFLCVILWVHFQDLKTLTRKKKKKKCSENQVTRTSASIKPVHSPIPIPLVLLLFLINYLYELHIINLMTLVIKAWDNETSSNNSFEALVYYICSLGKKNQNKTA